MVSNTSPPQKGCMYLYAIIEGTSAQRYDGAGLNGEDVYTISNGITSAVVSVAPANKKIRPERRHLKVHKEILRRLMEETTPLPMAFGIIADDHKAVERILANNQEVLVEQLARVQNKIEMGLRVTLNVPNIFEFFINTHSDLRTARDRYFGSNSEPSPENKIELGRMFDAILNEDRETFTKQVEDDMVPYCFESKRNKYRNESEVANLVFLIGRDQEAEFEKGILEAAGQFDNNFSFDYNGPWAPHNFVEIDLAI
ncbi:GvpL/GvpF family gas vesicle protein [Desulforhopalus vacuolatus]|uniref:GvpL/GvpF family gas vesicle protein n=1 Tax=Desulforhopalus vacuolatus TaxID=40414 RepID=UPI001962A736|nr:GvpL/GvpF family gas vesicle protein [Desulforhopalus vacuolatus]MBM9521175.1 GvpL/GvpF family gas vesicle protein [Desulforhopalus vacuolatus]